MVPDTSYRHANHIWYCFSHVFLSSRLAAVYRQVVAIPSYVDSTVGIAGLIWRKIQHARDTSRNAQNEVNLYPPYRLVASTVWC